MHSRPFPPGWPPVNFVSHAPLRSVSLPGESCCAMHDVSRVAPCGKRTVDACFLVLSVFEKPQPGREETLRTSFQRRFKRRSNEATRPSRETHSRTRDRPSVTRGRRENCESFHRERREGRNKRNEYLGKSEGRRGETRGDEGRRGETRKN